MITPENAKCYGLPTRPKISLTAPCRRAIIKVNAVQRTPDRVFLVHIVRCYGTPRTLVLHHLFRLDRAMDALTKSIFVGSKE